MCLMFWIIVLTSLSKLNKTHYILKSWNCFQGFMQAIKKLHYACPPPSLFHNFCWRESDCFWKLGMSSDDWWRSQISCWSEWSAVIARSLIISRNLAVLQGNYLVYQVFCINLRGTNLVLNCCWLMAFSDPKKVQ